MRGLSPVTASGGCSSSRHAGLSLSRPLLLRSTSSRRAGSVTAAHGPSCSVACGIFPDQGSNPCPLHRQADSQPLRHQGSPLLVIFKSLLSCPFLQKCFVTTFVSSSFITLKARLTASTSLWSRNQWVYVLQENLNLLEVYNLNWALKWIFRQNTSYWLFQEHLYQTCVKNV